MKPESKRHDTGTNFSILEFSGSDGKLFVPWNRPYLVVLCLASKVTSADAGIGDCISGLHTGANSLEGMK